MTRSKGKLVALAAVVVGVATLGVAGFAVREWVVEEYYIRKLGSDDSMERQDAAEKLGELRCLRAVPGLLEAHASRMIAARGSIALEAIGNIGRSALPALSEAFERGDPWAGDVYASLTVISESEGFPHEWPGNVEPLLIKVKEEATPGSALHQAAADLLPKVRAYVEEVKARSAH